MEAAQVLDELVRNTAKSVSLQVLLKLEADLTKEDEIRPIVEAALTNMMKGARNLIANTAIEMIGLEDELRELRLRVPAKKKKS